MKIITSIVKQNGRPALQFKFNENMSTLSKNYGSGVKDAYGEDIENQSNASISDYDIF